MLSRSITRKRRREPWPLLAACCALAGPVVAQDEPGRHALLIGINDYVSPKLIDLRGAVNDVTLVRHVLMTRYGFVADDITMLTNKDATREGILEAFEALVARVGEDDLVYIHYSGHGSQVEDFNSDESDGLDETILSHDARAGDVPDIIDDEFESVFARLKTHNALIVFDSCHSGTVTRAATPVRPRFVPPDDRAELYRRFAATTREVVLVEGLPHVLMTGAPSGEEALDGPVDGGWYGIFSYALARALDTLGPEATPVDLHTAAKRELKRIEEQLYTVPPEPQLEAPEARLLVPALPLLRAAAGERPSGSVVPAREQGNHAARRSWLEYELVGPDRVRLIGGSELNAQLGSQWGIYGAGETEFRYGNAIALGIVERVDRADALLALQFRTGDVPRDGRAALIAPPDVSGDVPIRIDAPDRRRARLERALREQAPSARIVDDAQFARFIFTLDDDTWRVGDAGGLRTALSFEDDDEDKLAEQIGRLLASSATATALLGLDNPAADLRLSVAIVDGTDRTSPRPQASKFGASFRVRAEGDERSAENSLMLAVSVDRDAYVTIVDVDTEGGVNLLFPNDYQRDGFLPDGFVRAGSVVRIPDSLESDNRAGFHWDYAPPAGKDTVRVFATTSAEMAKNIRSLIGGSGNPRSALGELRTALTAPAVRGIRVVATENVAVPAAPTTEPSNLAADWTAASIVIEVRR
jgi:hypothetical protein